MGKEQRKNPLGFGRRKPRGQKSRRGRTLKTWDAFAVCDRHLRESGITLTDGVLEYMEEGEWYSRREVVEAVYFRYDMGEPGRGTGCGVFDELWRRGVLRKARSDKIETLPERLRGGRRQSVLWQKVGEVSGGSGE